jgi:hypothetical protein
MSDKHKAPVHTKVKGTGKSKGKCKRKGKRKRKSKSKDKVHPRTGHEGPEGEYRCRPTLSLTSVLDENG